MRPQKYAILFIYVLSALSSGITEAYCYFYRGGAFANIQVGNLVLGGVSLLRRDWAAAFRYFCLPLAFAVGLLLSMALFRLSRTGVACPAMAPFLEALLLFLSPFFPREMDLAANLLLSAAAGIQLCCLSGFLKKHFPSTGCAEWTQLMEAAGPTVRDTRRNGWLQAVTFGAGLLLGSHLVTQWGLFAVWGGAIPLLICFPCMVIALFFRDIPFPNSSVL